MENNGNQSIAQEMDKCIICKKETKYPKDLNISSREHYVEGAGQLCDSCYHKIYHNRPKEHYAHE